MRKHGEQWIPVLMRVAPPTGALMFCGLSVGSGDADYGHMIYWVVAAVIRAFIAYGRLMLRPARMS